MLSLLKKREAAPPVQPFWHPNFRNFERLPDTKVVRTAFFINGAAITLALALGVYLGTKEWQLRSLNVQVAEEERKIARDKRASDQAVALFKKFQAEEARVTEVDTFLKSKPLVSAIVLRLRETLPANVALDNLDLREAGLLLRVSVRGTPEAALGYASTYLEQLKADSQLARLFDEINFTTTPALNPATGRMAVEFLLKPKAAGGKKP